MFEEIKNIKTSIKDLKSFGFTMGLILSIISAALFYYNNNIFQTIAILSSVFIGFGVLLPIVLKPIYMVWMIFALIFGWIMTRVILGIVFYFIITPIGLLTRLLGEDFLGLRITNSNSFWNQRNSDDEMNQDYEKQF
tara:strand:+ start:170 stop:580 length:411 start_codon:yes stop_codon:yes gene_type:complete